MLNKVEEELPSMSDVAKADKIELQEIMDNIARSTEGLVTQLRHHTQTQTDDLFQHPLRELLGFDKELRSIRGLLKVEMAERFSWKNASRGKSVSPLKSGTTQNTMTAFKKTSRIGSKG